jgi:hypothetical protein
MSIKASVLFLAVTIGQDKHKKPSGRKKKMSCSLLYVCIINNCIEEETLIHMFWTCPFAENCWKYVFPQRNQKVLEAFADIKEKLKVPLFS